MRSPPTTMHTGTGGAGYDEASTHRLTWKCVKKKVGHISFNIFKSAKGNPIFIVTIMDLWARLRNKLTSGLA